MLVLSRKAGQRIILSNGIVITLIATTTCTARIGISAPPAVRVWREELNERRQRKTEGEQHE